MRVSQHSDKFDKYAQLHGSFQWQVPEHFNIAQVCCARWAQLPDATKRVAIHATDTGARASFYTYFELQQQANRLSRVLAALGVARGDRVAIVMPQRFETAVAYMAVLQMGAVAMPLSMLFGPEALEYRLHDSEAVLAICDESSVTSVLSVRANCPLLTSVLGLDGAGAQADVDYTDALARVTPDFVPAATNANEAAVLIYTSGTTGNPKGAVIPHRALIGNLSGFVCSQNWFGFDGGDNAATEAIFWSPADWAWTGGLMDALLPTLYFGRPIVAYSGRFSPQTALELMGQYGVTHTFLFPTALKAMMKAYPGQPGRTVRDQFQLKLQAIMSAGEAVGDAVFDYCQAQLGVTVNEMFGQTEMNYIVGNCVVQWPAKPGSMGKGYPGHRVAVIDDAGNECPAGVAGDVALNRFDVRGQPDPIFFLGYWKNEAATRDKFTGDWCRTGDLATRDADGYLWYQGRSDDVFKAAGYRIGPGEIENCLVKHPAVANAAVVPKPDPERGALVKAYVVLAPDFVAAREGNTEARAQFDLKLVAELQAHVKDKLAPYEYPKEIEFVDALPTTTTGKLQRRVLRLQEEARAAQARSAATSLGTP
ncbi:MAG: AMP-binding protein [Rhodoferax sp.]|uniref:acyl-CoA synthetase n=1 Tax=Rhodoferax sp. TaxID=50421 RepID=UPI00181D1E41|nr:AMP-binding protein [Rhodoferax sp.]NMM13179.1 AMP-binding protein [Rhodoferax sp.]